jgi:hypothetical protein
LAVGAWPATFRPVSFFVSILRFEIEFAKRWSLAAVSRNYSAEMIFKSALLLACAWAVVHAGAKDVLDLTDDDFATRIKENDVVLVMFYAPW